MAQNFIKNILELLIVFPIILVTLNKSATRWKALILFGLFFIFNSFLLELPRQIPEFKIINGHWNWSGKIYAVLGSILFYLGIRKNLGQYNFFTWRQKEYSLKPTIIASVAVSILTIGISYFFFGKSEIDIETFFFQGTMPGLDEEIAFRGIMLGLLSTTLKPKLKINGLNISNPSILVTSILFGLIHSLQIDNEWNIRNNWMYFGQTFLFGLIVGWMTLKSGSILIPLISHNLTNMLGTVTTWIK
ncbi:MAG: CPBP family intramembrane metalloprotease [Lewinellaceae bacterium]|nr:CPBP family intramembrane metalloprotease [Lewinellaceae bacterium]